MRLLTLLFSCLLAIPALAKIKTENVTYKQGDTVLEGYLAYDDAKKGPRPAVIVVHDWMGLGENAQMRARQMAELGYVGFAADVYGKDSRPKNQDEAGQFAGKYKNDRALLRARMKAALDTVAANKNVNPKKIAVMGYCFGGTSALELARSGAPVVAVVSFHGGLSTPNPTDAKNIKGKVLVLHGAMDPFVKQDEVEGFQKEMNDAKVDYQFTSYAFAVHGFTMENAGNDPSKGMAYNAQADKHSFAAMKQFFAEVL